MVLALFHILIVLLYGAVLSISIITIYILFDECIGRIGSENDEQYNF